MLGFLGLEIFRPSALQAALNLSFMGKETLDSRITFTRASAGGRFNSYGNYELIGVNLVTNSTATALGYNPAGYITSQSGDGLVVTVNADNTVVSSSATAAYSSVQLAYSRFYDLRGIAQAILNVSIGTQNSTGTGNVSTLFYITAGVITGVAGSMTWEQMPNGLVRIKGTATNTGGSGVMGFVETFTAGSTYPYKITLGGTQVENGSVVNGFSFTLGSSTSGQRNDYNPAAPLVIGTSINTGVPTDASYGYIQPTSGSVATVNGATRVLTNDGTIAQFQPASTSFYNRVAPIISRHYRVNFDLTVVTGAAVFLSSVTNRVLANFSSSGNYSVDVVSQDSSVMWIIKRQSGPTDFTVSNITVKELTYAPLGTLVEEARTNICAFSNNLTGTNWASVGSPTLGISEVSPEGIISAYTWTRTTTAASYTAYSLGTGKAATALPYTTSYFIRKGTAQYCALRLQGVYPARVDVVFDLTNGTKATAEVVSGTFTAPTAGLVALGDGYYRLWVQATTDATTSIQSNISFNANNVQIDGVDSSATSSGHVYGCQIEAGTSVSSYIPTNGSSVTRAADNPVMTGTNFSSWFLSANAGTFVYDCDSIAPNGTFPTVLQAGPNANRFMPFVSVGAINSFVSGRIDAASVNQFNSGTANPITNGSRIKGAIAWDASGVSEVGNGGTVVTGGAITIPTGVNQLYIGQDGVAANYLNGHIRSIQYYQTKLTNVQIQALTA